jgi:hypothetical protein
MTNLVDLYLVYRILRRLTQPFTEWEAYKLGVIDAEGNILKKSNDRLKMDEKDSFTKFDLLILKMKRLLGTIPGGKTRLASYAAALWFLKEEKNLTIENLEEKFIFEFSKEYLTEGKVKKEEIANVASSGAVAGLTGEPPVPKKVMMRRFANNDVFVVDDDTYRKARLGKRKFVKYETYVGKDEIGNAIREFGRKYPKKPIILQNGENGPMIFLRYGKKGMFTESIVEPLYEEEKITQSDLKKIEDYADKLFKALDIDVEFTRHFLDRVNDARNVKQITPEELTALFRKTYHTHGKKISKLGPDAEAVIADMASNVNMPFVLQWDRDKEELDLVAKTVMRKKNFMTSNPKLKV